MSMSNIWDSLTEWPSGFTRLRQPAELLLCHSSTPSLSQTQASSTSAFAVDRYLQILPSTIAERWHLHPWPLLNSAQRLWPHQSTQLHHRTPGALQLSYLQKQYHMGDSYILQNLTASLRCSFHPLTHSFCVLTLTKCFPIVPLKHRRFHLKSAGLVKQSWFFFSDPSWSVSFVSMEHRINLSGSSLFLIMADSFPQVDKHAQILTTISHECSHPKSRQSVCFPLSPHELRLHCLCIVSVLIC